MDPIRNPYSPGAGSAPPALVGRERQLDLFNVALERLVLGRNERSLLMTGLRGVGKTVLLNEMGRKALKRGWIHQHLEATEDVNLPKSLATIARSALYEMSVAERSKERAIRALGVLRSFIKVQFTTSVGELSIDVEPRIGRADSGNLDSDLTDVFCEVGETAQQHGSGVLLTIDELQYVSKPHFSALIMALHRASQIGLPIMVAGAGLPSLPGLAGEAKSYAERLFTFSKIDSLNAQDAKEALQKPAEDEGASWSAEALDYTVSLTGGYPYFLQEFGKQAWNCASSDEITLGDIETSTQLATMELDNGFFRARIDRTTDAERDYLVAMATMGAGPHKSGAVAARQGKTTTQLGMVRDSLIKRGLCYAPRYGEMAFTVPMFDQFLVRAFQPEAP